MTIVLVPVLVHVLVIVPRRSQVIALRGSYNDGCRWEQVKWYLV
jgi:hypothetical protein